MAAASRQRRPRGRGKGLGGGPPALSRRIFVVLSDSLGPGRSNLHSARTGSDPIPANAAQYVNDSAAPLPYRQIAPIGGPIYFPDSGAFTERISPMERLLIDYQAAVGGPVGIVPCGVGGSSLTGGWNHATPGGNLVAAKTAYGDALARFAAADGAAPTLVASVIALSSNDSYDHATLKALWLGLVDNWRAFLGNTAPIILCGPVNGPESPGQSGSSKRRLVEEVAAERINCFVQHPPYPTTAGDNLHPTVSENRSWGAALAATANQAFAGTQPVPAFAMNSAQASELGSQLAIALNHTGLGLASRYGVPVISGGAHAALFEIAGGFHAPVLRWAGDGTGPALAGDYAVELRMRNAAWQLGPALPVTVTRAAQNLPRTLKSGHMVAAAVTGAFGGWSIAGFAVKKGWNYILFCNGTGGYKTNVAMTVDGNPATKVMGSVSADARNTELWRYLAAADGSVTLSVTHDGSAMSAIQVTSFAAEGYAGAPASSALIANADERGSGTIQHPGSVLSCPAGGAIVRLVIAPTSGGLILKPGNTALQLGGSPAGSLAAAYRETSGSVDYEGPGNYVRSASIALQPL